MMAIATSIENTCLEESLCIVTIVFLFPAELRFKELQVKVNQPNTNSLSSAKV